MCNFHLTLDGSLRGIGSALNRECLWAGPPPNVAARRIGTLCPAVGPPLLGTGFWTPERGAAPRAG
jgi:hypothetical protein